MASYNSSACLSEISSLETAFITKQLNVPGVIGIVVFYAMVFGVGIFASCRQRYNAKQTESEDVMLAGRGMHEAIGVLTLTATWVGGDYVNGSAEYIFTPEYGLLWCQAPFCFSLALIFNGVVFAKKMWQEGYVTMLDPFEIKYGRVFTAFLYIAALFAEVSFAAIAFAVLGASLNVIVGISYLWAVVLSAGVAIVYTLVGGLSSVAYTDVVQLIGIVGGLWLTVPFAMSNPAVSPISDLLNVNHGNSSWLGQPLNGSFICHYIDTALLLFFGAVPWQLYFQRSLAQQSAQKAKTLSIIAGFVALTCAIPGIMVGAIAASTDWNATEYRDFGEIPVPPCDYPLALPLVMRFLTPVPVAVIGLGAVSAAVMSSSDSCILSSSTMFAHNVYEPLRNALGTSWFRGSKASDREVVWVLRISMFFVGAITTIIAITVKSIVALIILCVDFPYCILFPQLLCVIHLPFANAYGATAGLILGLFFRMTGGEPFLELPPLIKYPWYDEATGIQHFPYKTMTTIISFIGIIAFSWIAKLMHKRYEWFRMMDNVCVKAFNQDGHHKICQIRLQDKEVISCNSYDFERDEQKSNNINV